jgi:cytosine/adenosine deaminase-related metal-dependent hydrolase
LTGTRDLLDELRIALSTRCATAQELLAMVTTNAARLLRLRYAGALTIGAPADITIVPATNGDASSALLAATRRDIALVVVGGRPLVGVQRLAPVFLARRVTPRPLVVDGTSKLADSGLVRRIESGSIAEPGVSAG